MSRVILGLILLLVFSVANAAADKLPLDCFKVYADSLPLAGEFSRVTMRFNADESQVLVEFTKEDQLKPSLFFHIPKDYFYNHAATYKGIELPLGGDKKVKIYRLAFRMKKQARFDYHAILVSSLNVTMSTNDSLVCDAEGAPIQ